MDTETRVIQRLQKGDLGAFDQLFERHRRSLFAYVLELTRDRQAAEDIVQECFVKLVRNVATIKPKRGAGPWLYRVARNRCIDLLRQRQRRVETGDDPALLPAPGSPDALLAASDDRAQLRDALRSLADADRELLLMRFYGNLKFREMADALDRPLGTVLWQTQQALERLRACITDGGRP